MKDENTFKLLPATPGCRCAMCRLLALKAEYERSAQEMLPEDQGAASAMLAAADRLGEVLLPIQIDMLTRNQARRPQDLENCQAGRN